MNAQQFYHQHGRKAVQDIVDQAAFPIIGYDPVGMNFVHKQCEQAPFKYHPHYNSWSEDYAVDIIPLEDLQAQLTASLNSQ